MATIFKISGYLVDPEDDYEADNVESELKRMGMIARHLHIESENAGEWTDDNPLNRKNCDLAYCEQYFRSQPVDITSDMRRVESGEVYRHFKEGKLVKVLAVAQDTENVGSFSVVYLCLDKENNLNVWSRPYDMFVSEVDHEKYPEAKQKYRFEKVE